MTNLNTAQDSRSTLISVAGQSIRLIHPEAPEDLLDDPSVQARNLLDDYMPYWAFLWPGAFLLAEAVAQEKWPEQLTALEIGCGLGLTGFVALYSGISRVVFTDHDHEALDYVRRTGESNGFGPDRFETALLDWRDLPDQSFPVILGADILYEDRLVPLVVGLLERMLDPGGLALVSGPERAPTAAFSPALIAAGFEFETKPIQTIDERGRKIRGTLHRIRK